MNNELESMWKEEVMAPTDTLPQHFLGVTEAKSNQAPPANYKLDALLLEKVCFMIHILMLKDASDYAQNTSKCRALK